MMHPKLSTGPALALLTGAALAAPAALAQSASLVVGGGSGKYNGAVTLTDAGTTASGIYDYYDAGSGTPLSSQNRYDHWFVDSASAASVSGGSIRELNAFDTSTVSVSGGTIDTFNDYSVVGVSGGDVSYLNVYGTAVIGGGKVGIIKVADTGTAVVTGASIALLGTYNNSGANISGGGISYLLAQGASMASVSGGDISNLYTYDTSVLDLLGSGLAARLTGTFQDFPSGTYSQYQITGTLRNGDALNATYFDHGGTLEFNGVAAVPSVPEASSIVSLGLLLGLGLGGAAVGRRRRATQAV